MSIRLLFAAIAVVSVPMAVMGQQPAPERKQAPTKRYCRADNDIAGRLSGIRRCETKSERDARKHEARMVVDRIQNMKATSGR